MRDFRDANLQIVVVEKGVDASYQFTPSVDGTFVYNNWAITCVGKTTAADWPYLFAFPVSRVEQDGIDYIEITFPGSITEPLRDNKIYWMAAGTNDGVDVVLGYGEVWLKS